MTIFQQEDFQTFFWQQKKLRWVGGSCLAVMLLGIFCVLDAVNDGEWRHPPDLWQSVAWDRAALGGIPGRCAKRSADCGHQNVAGVRTSCSPGCPWHEPCHGTCTASCGGTAGWLYGSSHRTRTGTDATLPWLPSADHSRSARSTRARTAVDQQARLSVSIIHSVQLYCIIFVNYFLRNVRTTADQVEADNS